MIANIDTSLIDWSRAQFALTAMYHWLFVPLTLGLGIIQALMETLYVKTGKEYWKTTARFWMKLFGINFAIGVATGLILEFELAFFMEATFIAVMYFGWEKVSKRFHLASTWLTIAGATLSALWILVANAWMQYPAGMHFNPDTVRNEMLDFWAVALSPVAINKFFHTVLSGWVTGATFVIGVSCWYLYKKREQAFALRSIKVGAIFGLVASVLLLWTGDGSAYQVADKQPMKLAAMEGLYQGEKGAGLVGIGILNPNRSSYDSPEDPFLFKIEIPKMLSLLAERDADAFVPGITDLIEGGYTDKTGQPALSAKEKIAKGKLAIQALADYRQAKKEKDEAGMAAHRTVLEENFAYFGYGYLQDPSELIPPVGLSFYSFHIMVLLGGYLILLFLAIWILHRKSAFLQMRWLHLVALWSIPLAYIAGQAGWIVAEVGRQPWAIQDILPTIAGISRLETASVQTTFFLFLILFTVLLIAELRILIKAIQAGPETETAHSQTNEYE